MIFFSEKCVVYEFLDNRGLGVITEWIKEVSHNRDLVARFDQKLDLLENYGNDLPPNLLAGTKFKNIDKLRVFGRKTTWRILIFKKMADRNLEFTLLFVAQEKDRKLIPKDAERRADENRKEVISNPTKRKIYERD